MNILSVICKFFVYFVYISLQEIYCFNKILFGGNIACNLKPYIVFGWAIVPCKIMFDKIKPKPGKKISIPAHGLSFISIIGTIA